MKWFGFHYCYITYLLLCELIQRVLKLHVDLAVRMLIGKYYVTCRVTLIQVRQPTTLQPNHSFVYRSRNSQITCRTFKEKVYTSVLIAFERFFASKLNTYMSKLPSV